LTVVYAVVILLLALSVGAVIYAPTSPAGVIFLSSILIGFGTFAVIEYRRLKEFGYDEKGVYRWGKLLFAWSGVRKISLSFSESSHSVTLMAAPSIGAIIGGGVIDHATWIGYGISTVFALDDGSVVAIPSNLDRMTSEGMIEDFHELAKTANPSVEIE
jgi:hypothetical protein